ncbi:MAG: type IV pilus twitching motility protein PilT [Tatlockia sp.]|nr:type IV pilus twitching motility protein PilT [Tatlockia sp.]
MFLAQLISQAIEFKASDLHLSTGLPPIIRVNGYLQKLDFAILQEDELRPLLIKLMNSEQQKIFNEFMELDFAIYLENLCRLRVNVFKQARGISAVFRIIPNRVPTLEELQLPPVFKEIAAYSKGLVLITGPTGSGKSTTLAALIDYISKNHSKHIVTIEDPIEFIHQSSHCLIHQREIHRDTRSFKAALHSVLREDPDIILLGELRCLETIRLALTAAETGHLVFATLHTNSAASTVNRLVDAFPGEEKNLIRSILSQSLQAIIAQTLLEKKGGGRVAAFEILIANPAIKNLIRENKIAQIYSALQTGQRSGMHTLDQYLLKLVENGSITEETATQAALTPDLLSSC